MTVELASAAVGDGDALDVVGPAGIPQTNCPIPKTKMLEKLKDIRLTMLDFEDVARVEKFRGTANRPPLLSRLIY